MDKSLSRHKSSSAKYIVKSVYGIGARPRDFAASQVGDGLPMKRAARSPHEGRSATWDEGQSATRATRVRAYAGLPGCRHVDGVRV